MLPGPKMVWAIWLIGLFYLLTLVLGYGAGAMVGAETIKAAPGGVNSAAPLLALELGGRGGDDEASVALRPPDELGQHPGLADARLALDRDTGRRPALERAQKLFELSELDIAPDHRTGEAGRAHPASSLPGSDPVPPTPVKGWAVIRCRPTG